MPSYEYKVVPAPTKGVKAKGVKTAEARFSFAIQEFMNSLSADGWEYQRAETLPSTERAGIASTTVEWRNVLVFRRLRENAAEVFVPELLPPPETPAEPVPAVPMAATRSIPVAPETPAIKSSTSPKSEPTVTADQVEKPSAATPDISVDDPGSISTTIKKFASARKPVKSDS